MTIGRKFGVIVGCPSFTCHSRNGKTLMLIKSFKVRGRAGSSETRDDPPVTHLTIDAAGEFGFQDIGGAK